jgi:hypothetical protein
LPGTPWRPLGEALRDRVDVVLSTRSADAGRTAGRTTTLIVLEALNPTS